MVDLSKGKCLNSPMDKIGERIKHARKSARYSQRALAKVMGINVASFHGWERLGVIPSSESLSKIAAICEVDGGWLLMGEAGK